MSLSGSRIQYLGSLGSRAGLIPTKSASKHGAPAASVSRREVVPGLVSQARNLCPFSAAPPPPFFLSGKGWGGGRAQVAGVPEYVCFFVIAFFSS